MIMMVVMVMVMMREFRIVQTKRLLDKVPVFCSLTQE